MIGLTLVWSLSAKAQSTDELRFTYGEGPFPLYVTGSAGFAHVKPLFGSFVKDYTNENGGQTKRLLHTMEFNFGAAVNCHHCLAIKGFRIRNMAFEVGFMKAQRRLQLLPGHQLHLVESVGSARAIYRFTQLYPLTLQLHAGLNYYSFYQIREVIETDSVSSFERVRAGSSLTDNHEGKLALRLPGYNFRVRVALFDPSGAGSGFGLFGELSYMGKWRNENFNTAYGHFHLSTQADSGMRRNYFNWNVGLIVPLALTMH